MATFEIEHGGKTYEIEAPTQDAAMQAFRSHVIPKDPMTTGEKIGETINRAADGFLFGFGDNINAAGDAVFSGGLFGQKRSDAPTWRERYEENLDFYRGNAEQLREDHPNIAGSAELAGGLLAAGGAIKSGATLLNGGMSAARASGVGAIEGAGYGALHSAGVADGENVGQSAASGALIGGAIGGAVSPLVQAFSNSVANKATRKFDSIDDLEIAKRAAYEHVDQLGVKYSPEAMTDLIQGIADEMRAGRIHAMRHPKASSMLDDIEGMVDQPQSLSELDQLRQVVRRDVAGSLDQSEAHFGRKMIANIDEFIDAARPTQVVTGNPQAAAGAIKEARQLNSRAMKHRAVADAVESAELRAASTNSGANTGNAIRQNARRVLEQSKKPGKGNLTAKEAELLERVVRGGAGQNFARGLGKRLGGALGAFTSLGGTMTTGNPLFLGVQALGKIGQSADEAMTRANVAALLAEILQGGADKLASQPVGANVAQKGLIHQLSPIGAQ